MATNMTFVDYGTPVPADWLNNVNTFVNTPQNLPTLNQINMALSYTMVETAGAKGDGVELTSGNITSGTSVFTVGSSYFVPGDVGKTIIIMGAGVGGDSLTTTIQTYTSGTQVSLATTATNTVVNAITYYGTNNTTAIQAAVNTNVAVAFTPGKIYIQTGTINVPITCKSIYGDTAWMIGSGISTGLAGFEFQNFYQSGGNVEIQAEKYVLPSLRNYTYAVFLLNAAFLRIYSDTIRNCAYGYFVSCTSASNYCFELELAARNMWHLRNLTNTIGGAFYMQSNSTATSAFQGNHCIAFYSDDNWTAVYQDFVGSGAGGNINNVYDILEHDQSTYAVYNTKNNFTSQNLYRFPAGLTSNGNAQMFVNVGTQDTIEVLGTSTNDPTFTAANNFQWNGCTNRPGISTQSGGVPAIYVSASGSDTTGTGHDTAPFATIQKALNVWSSVDLFGQTVFISLRDGTYAGATLNSFGSSGPGGVIAIIGDVANPGNVLITGNLTANGYGANLEVSGMTINAGVLAQNGGVIQIAPAVIFGASTSGFHIQAQLLGQIQINSNYTVTGTAANHYLANTNGVIQNQGATAIAFTGTLPFTVIAGASQGGQLSVPGITYTGAGVSGTRYVASLNSVIFTNSGGASYFPGTVVGSTSTGGQYA